MEYLQLIAAQAGIRLDAGETALIAKELEAVKAATYDVKCPEFKARQFIPVNSSPPAGAETVSYDQWDSFGQAKVIGNYADDLPSVDVLKKRFTNKIASLGNSYSWSIQDLRASAMAGGMSLDAKRAMAARRAMEAAIDDLAAAGDANLGMSGFAAHASVPLVTPTTGTWSGATALQIIADLNKLVQSIITTTKQVHLPNTLLLDTDSFALINQKPMSADSSNTVLRYFLENNPYIQSIDQWHRLDLANAAGNGPRCVAYDRSPEVLGLEIPQEFEQLPPQARNLKFVVPCHARCGGVIMHYPKAVAYMDGI